MKPPKLIVAAIILITSVFILDAGEIRSLIGGSDPANVISIGQGESARFVYGVRPGWQDPESNQARVLLKVVKDGKTLHLPALSVLKEVNQNTTAKTVTSHAALPFEIGGPATIELTENFVDSLATLDVKRVGTFSEPVCIPIEAGSNFSVILESSSDLVNWTPANPGTYSGTEAKRFFRTRIVKQ